MFFSSWASSWRGRSSITHFPADVTFVDGECFDTPVTHVRNLRLAESPQQVVHNFRLRRGQESSLTEPEHHVLPVNFPPGIDQSRMHMR